MKKIEFKIVTKSFLKTLKNKRYGGGYELKIGDKITFGLNRCFSNLCGIPSQVRPNETPGFYLTIFVLCEANGFLYELY